jgi:hypothetical protein
MGMSPSSRQCAFTQWTLPVRAPGLRGAETSLDVEHRHIAHQQDRSRRHFANAEFALLELCSLAPRAGYGCGLNIRIRNRVCATEPVVEPDLAEFCFVAGDE